MKQFLVKALKYAALGIVLVPFSILTHEAGHFLAYVVFGAGNVELHSVSVSADKEALSAGAQAVVNIVGPLITYLTIAVCAYFLWRKNYHPLWTILGLAAPIGRIVNPIYLYFRILGYRPSPNFDEFNFSRNIGLEPVFLAALTTLIVLATLIFFTREAWRAGKFKEIGAVALSLACGLVVWSLVGGLILP